MEGPAPGELVAAAGVGPAGGVLAVAPVHAPGRPRRHGAVRRRGGELAPGGGAHAHADGERPLPPRGIQPRSLLPQPAGRRRRQQPRRRRRAPPRRRPPGLLRHPGRLQHRLGELLLLRRARQERALPVICLCLCW
uniref:Uncharacterized protein n=1 Tax=Zea mays TaxID=4577 RepID=C4JA71_MAIZE|nr:unknown [Zea mays]